MPSSSLLMHQKLSASMFLRASSSRLDTSKFSTSSSRRENESNKRISRIYFAKRMRWTANEPVRRLKEKWSESSRNAVGERKTKKGLSANQGIRHSESSDISPPFRRAGYRCLKRPNSRGRVGASEEVMGFVTKELSGKEQRCSAGRAGRKAVNRLIERLSDNHLFKTTAQSYLWLSWAFRKCQSVCAQRIMSTFIVQGGECISHFQGKAKNVFTSSAFEAILPAENRIYKAASAVSNILLL